MKRRTGSGWSTARASTCQPRWRLLAREAVEQRHLDDAGAAPGRPEVEQQRPAAPAGHLDRRAVDALELERPEVDRDLGRARRPRRRGERGARRCRRRSPPRRGRRRRGRPGAGSRRRLARAQRGQVAAVAAPARVAVEGAAQVVVVAHGQGDMDAARDLRARHVQVEDVEDAPARAVDAADVVVDALVDERDLGRLRVVAEEVDEDAVEPRRRAAPDRAGQVRPEARRAFPSRARRSGAARRARRAACRRGRDRGRRGPRPRSRRCREARRCGRCRRDRARRAAWRRRTPGLPRR